MPPGSVHGRFRPADREIVGPAAGAVVCALVAGAPSPKVGLFAALLLGVGARLTRPQRHPWLLLPGVYVLLLLGAGALVGTGLLAVAQIAMGQQLVSQLGLFAIFASTMVAGGLPALGRIARVARRRPVRVAVIGPQRVAQSLTRDLSAVGIAGYVVVGHVAPDGAGGDDHGSLGRVGGLGDLVASGAVDLLVLTSQVPRVAVLEALAESLHHPVRVTDLSALYERIFGRVPVAEINAEWFQALLDATGPPRQARAKRALDLIVATVCGLVVLPVLGVIALLVRRDGGPAFFTQLRIGEAGRPFQMIKLRTMKHEAHLAAHWAEFADPRITPIGRLLRRSHLDELPQLLNVLRGEMSIVGPRPEQPEIVSRLERVVPFYQRRHLIKPGITGWAQIHCGYAGSESGSAWKLCHDLYYLKYRSLLFDLVILAITITFPHGRAETPVDAPLPSEALAQVTTLARGPAAVAEPDVVRVHDTRDPTSAETLLERPARFSR